MTHRMLTFSLAAAMAASPGFVAAQQSVVPFDDEACPAATPFGRHLNELNAEAKPSNDDLMSTAKQLVDAYRGCVRGYDKDAHDRSTSDESSDYVVTHRMYSRLALARSLQRVGAYAAQLGDAKTAQLSYQAALKPLDEIDSIGGDVAGSIEGSERKLLTEAHDLRGTIEAAQKTLPAGGTAKPGQQGSPTP